MQTGKISNHSLHKTINIQYQQTKKFALRTYCCKACPLHGFIIFLNYTTYYILYILYIVSTIMCEFVQIFFQNLGSHPTYCITLIKQREIYIDKTFSSNSYNYDPA